MNNLTIEAKSVIVGMALCILGAVLYDFGVHATSFMLMGLGGMTVIVGPLAVGLGK